MAAEESPKPIRRFQIGMNVILQAAFLALIVAMVNYFSFHHFRRWDFTRDHRFSLSDQTRHLLSNLDDEVRVIVFFSGDARNPGGEVYRDLEALMKEYSYASNKKFIPEFVDPFRNFSRARELSAKYKFGNENVVILDYKGRTKFVTASDMAVYDQRFAAMGQAPQYKAFRGEQALTSALIELIEAKENRVYLLEGHGEPGLESDAMKVFRTFVERQNVKLHPLKLQTANGIPEDARAVMLIGAKYDISPRELLILRDYWERKGRLFIALDPNVQMPHLNAWLNELGVTPNNDRVMGVFKMPGVDALAVVKDVQGEFSKTSAVTKRLSGATPTLPSSTQSLGIADKLPAELKIQPLITAVEGYWGETKYNVDINAGQRVELDVDDNQNPVLAISVEQGGVTDERVQVESSRMILIGNSDFAISTALVQIPANVDFALSALNWLRGRQDLIGIAPKEKQTFVLNLSEKVMGQLTLLTMLVIPGSVLLLAFMVWLRRRA